MATFPGAVKTFTTLADNVDDALALHQNEVRDEVTAIEQTLRTDGVPFALTPDSSGGARTLGSTSKFWGLGYLKGLALTPATELTIATGAITVTQGIHRVDTEADAAADDLTTITAGSGVVSGSLLLLYAENVARVVTVKTGGNILVYSRVALDATHKVLVLLYDGSNWREVTPRGVESFCAAYHSTTEALTADGVLSLDTEAAGEDPEGLHDTVTNNSRITIPSDGIYEVTGQTVVDTEGTGDANVSIRKSGSTKLREVKVDNNVIASNNQEIPPLTWTGRLLASDSYIELFVDKSDGSSWTFGSTSANRATRLTLRQVR